MQNIEGKLNQLKWIVDGKEIPLEVSSIEEYYDNEEEILERVIGNNGGRVIMFTNT